MGTSTASDIFIPTVLGTLFARQWIPGLPSGASPVILFHDSLGSEQWRDFPARIAETTARRVIAYDRLGFGKSDPNPRTLQRDFVQDEARTGLAAVRAAFAVDRMILMGHSVGGGMAIAAGAALSAATDAVITLAAQAFVEDRTVAGIQQARIAFQDEEQIGRLAKYHGNKARWVLDAWIETLLAPSFSDWSLDDDLRQLRCPILAIHGDQDEYGSRAHLDRIAAFAGGGVHEALMENVHHMPHRENPDDVLRTIGDFANAV